MNGHDSRLQSPSACSHQKHAFAVDLFVEQLVGFIGLVELPAMGEELVDIDTTLDRETRAFSLDDVREGPGGDQRQLPPQQMRADIDMNLAAFADEAHR